MILQQPFAISPSPTGFNYYSPFTIQSGQVPSTQTDFPILISITDTRLKTVANGGHVLDAEGDDIRPYSDSSVTTAITGYEKVFYDGTNGILEMWVKRSSVADALVTYLAYGNASLTTDGSSTTTWSNNFLGVWHLKDGTTLSVADSTGLNASPVNHGATATTGKIDGGASFVAASSQWIDSNVSNVFTAAVTVSAWVNATSFPNSFNAVVVKEQSVPDEYARLSVNASGKLVCEIKATGVVSYSGTGTNTLSTSTNYYLIMTYDSVAGLIGYVNASSDKTVAANGTMSTGTAGNIFIGDNNRFAGTFWNGKIDEARVAGVARSADWITTEYNNQNAPTTFQTIGTEVPL